MYVSITPKQILDEVGFIGIYTDSSRWAGGSEQAAITKDSNDKFALWIDPLEVSTS